MRDNEAGVTLIEVVIAITLLSLLSVAMLFAMRIGLNTYSKTQAKLMDNRRVAGAQRILLAEIEGLVPVVMPCTGMAGGEAARLAFFQGEPQSMRLVSTFSLQQGWRGEPHVLEFTVIPGAEERGVRLVVNEVFYGSPMAAGRFCVGLGQDMMTGKNMAKFPPVGAGPKSFVLADKLEYCRFSYQGPGPAPDTPPVWSSTWARAGWPMGIRVEMAPYDPDPARVQPIAATAPLLLHRSPEIVYEDR